MGRSVQKYILPEGFSFQKPPRLKVVDVEHVEPVEPKPRPKRVVNNDMLHISKRHGSEWPIAPGTKGYQKWTGWLTHREYNMIEHYTRYDVRSIYDIGMSWGIKFESCNRMFYIMKNAGIIEGDPDLFIVTPEAAMLFDMTDQYILQLPFEDDDG